MNKDKMIKDMRAIIRREHSDCMSNLCENCEYYAMNFCGSAKTATALYNANYRKVTEDEIVESMKTYERARNETARKILQELYSTPHEYHENKIFELAKKYGVEE